jgi:cytochrome c-type biogenesis protein CcmH/NrfG
MEDHPCYHNFDINSPKSKELLRRFQKLSPQDKKELIASICQNNKNAEEANEAFETILSLLNKDKDKVNGVEDDITNDLDDYEEEESEDEDSDNIDETNECDKRKHL